MPVRTPSEVIDLALASGTNKISLSSPGNYARFTILSILAGAYIALGGTLSLVVGFGFPEISAANPGLQKLLSGLVFPIGLMLVVVVGGELFTGNNALLMPGLMRRRFSGLEVLRNWTMVYLGNLVGALAVAYFLVYLPGLTTPEPYNSAICGIATNKVYGATPLAVFLKGIGANWCVCLAVWLALAGKRLSEKLLACQIPVMAFVILGYEHCVANMFFIPAGMLQGADINVMDALINNMVPATLGNIIGGALFVGTLYAYLATPKNRTR